MLFMDLQEIIDLKRPQELSDEEHPRTGSSKKYIVGVSIYSTCACLTLKGVMHK